MTCIAKGSGGIVSPFTAWDLKGDNSPGNSAGATIYFNSDGTVTYAVQFVDVSNTVGTESWFSPTTTGIGNSYWVRFTVTSGTLTTNQASTWTALSSARAFDKQAVSGAVSATVTVEIASDSGGTNIVFTSTGNIVSYQHTL
jgi:hypothetical protein